MSAYVLQDPRLGFHVNSDVIKLKKLYEGILESFKTTDLDNYGNYIDKDGPELRVQAGSVKLALQIVAADYPGLQNLFGRVVFVYRDAVKEKNVVVFAIQFGVNGVAYCSDARDSELDTGFTGRILIPSSINYIALGVNAGIVAYHTKELAS